MKKILLGTTALVGAATLIAGAAFAGEDPKVTVGGFSTFEAAYINTDNDNHERADTFRNDNEIHFNVAGKSDAGLGYGAEIDLIADIDGGDASATPGFSNAGIVARRTYGWLQGDNWGHVEFGSNDGVDTTLKVDASNIARASGGINGDWRYFANTNSPAPVGAPATITAGAAAAAAAAASAAGTFNNSAGGRLFITSANLPVANGPTTGFYSDVYTNDTKVTYYTPRFSGFQAGVSYAPSLTNRGENSTSLIDVTAPAIGGSNVWSGGINYENQFDQIGVAAAVTGETAHIDNTFTGVSTLKDVEAWNAGLKLSYMGFSAAGSYGDWSDSANVSGTSAWYATGGLAYETGPFGASVTYLYSEDKTGGTVFDDKFQNASVGVDYKLAPGLTPFIEYSWVDVDGTGGTAASGATETKSNIVLVGSQLSF